MIWFGENLSGGLTNVQLYRGYCQIKRCGTTCRLFLPGDYITYKLANNALDLQHLGKEPNNANKRNKNLSYAEIYKPTKNWQMLFDFITVDHSFQMTGRLYVPSNWEHNKKWCRMLKAKKIAVPTYP